MKARLGTRGSTEMEENFRLVRVYEQLKKLHPKWHVEFGPREGVGWISGPGLLRPEEGPMALLLDRIADRLNTRDRKIIAASFALRFGWSAGAAIAPYLLHACVPDIGLDNISLKFSDATLFERVALRTARINPVGSQHEMTKDAIVECSAPTFESELLGTLRNALRNQSGPVIEALHEWSRFSKRALWGQVVSSWGGQFTAIFAHLKRHADALPYVRHFFDSPGFVEGMRPIFYPVHHAGVTRIYHRRASCCLYYKLPAKAYCASCPLISQGERVRRNKEWIDQGFAP